MDVRLYEDHRGRWPVQEFIDDLSSRTEIDQILVHVRELGIQGHLLRRPVSAALGDGIYELRPGPNRILYGFDGGDAVLLHALRKKTREIPDEDIRLALRRFKEWRQR